MEYTNLDFNKGTLVQRDHRREVVPPGMVEIWNTIPPRSDKAITLRPDTLAANEVIYGFSGDLTIPGTSQIADAINSASGLYGSNQIMYFTSFIPYGIHEGYFQVLSDEHSSGTCSTTSGSSVITGSGAGFLERAYRGAIVRFLTQGTKYSGASYKVTESPATTGEYYFTKLDGSDPGFLGDYLGFGYGAGTRHKLFNAVGSLNYGAEIGDNDAIGFDTLYVESANTDPNNYSGEGSFWGLYFGRTNISGSKNKWNASGSGTNEYYLTTRAGAVPNIVPDDTPTGPDCPEYIRQVYNYSFLQPGMHWTDRPNSFLGQFEVPAIGVTERGELGSLPNYGIGFGNNDALGFDTIYIRCDDGNPDVVTTVGGGTYYAYPFDTTYKYLYNKRDASLILPYYMDISHGQNGCTWTKSAKYYESGDGKRFYPYYLKINAADPGLDGGGWKVAIDMISAYNVDIDDVAFPGGNRDRFAYGDAPEDNLGYDTIYVLKKDGTSPTASTIDMINAHRYKFSNYSWVASAGGGTNEYYLAQQDGTALAAAFPTPIYLKAGDSGPAYVKGSAVESLSDLEWAIGKAAADGLANNTVYIRSDDGDPDTLELPIIAFYNNRVYISDYKWNASGTANEYYLTTVAGADPSIAQPTILEANGSEWTEGTAGSLGPHGWDYGDNDALGYDTIYIYSTVDPNGAVGTGVGDDTAPIKIQVRDASADYTYYLVDTIKSDNEMTIFGEASVTASSSVPTFYYNHNPFRSDYKINVQPYTSGIIYCTPAILGSVNEDDISGPFYSGLQKGDWKYENDYFEDYTSLGRGVVYYNKPCLATNGMSYVQVWPNYASGEEGSQSWSLNSFISLSYGITGNDSWLTYSTWADEDETDGFLTVNGQDPPEDYFSFASIKAYSTTYLAGGNVWSDSRPGIAFSTDTYGLAWTTAGDATYEWAGDAHVDTDYTGIDAAWNSLSPGRIVALYWRPDDDRIVVRYTDDSGGTWNDTNIAGSGNTYFAGGSNAEQNCQIDYIAGNFIIQKADGFYYGDGATFTEKTVGTASNITSIGFNNSNEWAAKDGTTVWTCSSMLGTWTATTFPDSETAPWIMWDKVGERWIVNTQSRAYWCDNLDIDAVRGTPLWAQAELNYNDEQVSTNVPTKPISDNAAVWWGLYDGTPFSHVALTRFSYYFWDIDKFQPISEDFRSTTFSVLNGYVILIGTREREFELIDNYHSQTLSVSPSIDGTEKDFTTKVSILGDHGVKEKSVKITATVTDGTNESTETITDSGGAGILNGDVSATGTIEYDTGNIRLVFNDQTVKNATTIKCTYIYLTEGETTGWIHYPRRIRWTAPKTYADFEGVGSGTGDANGDGTFLDSRPVNGRIVVFETNKISSIVPRGDVDDPWDFDDVHKGVSLFSNPAVVNDFCYFIASDGLLWRTDGISAQEVGASYDATKFDDFEEKLPITLHYSQKLNALLAYFYDKNETSPSCHAISLANGSVTEIGLPTTSDSVILSRKPRFVTTIEDSEDDRILISRHPDSNDTDRIPISFLSVGRGITGIDQASENDSSYWYGEVETGEMFLVPEGGKSSIKHYILRGYTAAGTKPNTYRPYIAVEDRSLEDSQWHAVGDEVGTATMTTTALTGSGTAWSNTIATPSGTGTQQECDGAEVTFTLPCAAKKARVYLDSTLQVSGTDYTTSGKTITFTTAPGATKTLYAYWDSYPEVIVQTGDVFKSSEGFHIVRTISSAQDIALDRYLTTGSETVTHYSTTQMPDGEDQTIIGTNRLTEGVRVRWYIIPQYDKASNPKIVKLSGVSIGHVPSGSKILQPTGS